MPGPGRYDSHIAKSISNLKNTPSVIFTPPRLSRFQPESKEETPGPGQYKCEKARKLLSNFSSSCVYSISKTRRDAAKSRSGTPGPTSYDTDRFYSKSSKKIESKFKFVHGFPS